MKRTKVTINTSFNIDVPDGFTLEKDFVKDAKQEIIYAIKDLPIFVENDDGWRDAFPKNIKTEINLK